MAERRRGFLVSAIITPLATLVGCTLADKESQIRTELSKTPLSSKTTATSEAKTVQSFNEQLELMFKVALELSKKYPEFAEAAKLETRLADLDSRGLIQLTTAMPPDVISAVGTGDIIVNPPTNQIIQVKTYLFISPLFFTVTPEEQLMVLIKQVEKRNIQGSAADLAYLGRPNTLETRQAADRLLSEAAFAADYRGYFRVCQQLDALKKDKPQFRIRALNLEEKLPATATSLYQLYQEIASEQPNTGSNDPRWQQAIQRLAEISRLI